MQMKMVKRLTPWIVTFGSVVFLAACATTTAGPNAGAAAAPVSTSNQTKPTVGQEAGAVVDNKVQIVFPKGGDTLTPDADKQLDLAARLFRDANPVVMFTTGYTDRSGDEFANLLLSARRAEAVKRGLVARGIPADRLLIQALGESELANSSDPLSPENRRVVITWRLL
jgi:outer membrane protein OmpA-like peptidoglycan-associated protein